MNKDIEILIERNSHNKKARSYSLIIDGDGNVKDNRPDYAKSIGKQFSKISPENMNRLIHEFKDLYFFSFKDSYESPNYSISKEQEHISVSLRLGDKFKKVEYTEDSKVEPQLKTLVNEIEKLTIAD